MSVHMIYLKDGVKHMRPIHTREEYLALRNGGEQRQLIKRIRAGEEGLKHKLVQMNYSCLPNDDGTLKGSKRMSTTVGMDIDFVAPKELTADKQKAWLRERMAEVPELVLSKKDELGLQMFEHSATKGYHLAFRRRPELSQEGNLKWASDLLGVAYDSQAKDITRVFFTTTEAELLYLDDAIFAIAEAPSTLSSRLSGAHGEISRSPLGDVSTTLDMTGGGALGMTGGGAYPTSYHGIPFERILAKYWEVNNQGFEPTEGDRDTLTYQLACDLRHICGKNADWLDQVIPCYDGFTLEEKREKIRNALTSEYNGFPQRLRNTLNLLATDNRTNRTDSAVDDEEVLKSCSPLQKIPKLPMGIKDSIDAVGSDLAMPIITAVCPCIGALATGVKLDVHGRVRGLNLISYIVGEFASRKGDIDPVVDAWMSEVSAMDEMYQAQEDDFRRKKRAAKNKKDQPEEPKLPVRYIPLNNTVANLAERLANVEGKHAFSFTPEADTVAQKWRSAMSDFSVLLRQSYDGSRYDREAKSAEAVNVHIKHLLWNVVMCGTPDALYRVVTNYTDGFQSRIALAYTPDNTYAKLEDKPYVLTTRQTERIQQVAHLLPLMAGEVVLPKLEAKGRDWLEKIRLEAMKNDDRVKARERFRTCVTAQRMVCCLMLCRVCEQLIQKHGLNGAETQLKSQPTLWRDMLLKAQTPAMLDMYDVIADQLLDSALYYFRDRIEAAYRSRDYASGCNVGRSRRSKNDSIYERLDVQFSFDQAMQFSVAVKGADVTRNSVQQMLKNWRKQGLVSQADDGQYRKVS